MLRESKQNATKVELIGVLLEPDVAKAFPTAESGVRSITVIDANCWTPSIYTSRK
jgi:hypothetical protein